MHGVLIVSRRLMFSVIPIRQEFFKDRDIMSWAAVAQLVEWVIQ